MADIKQPALTFGGVKSGRRQPSHEIFDPTEMLPAMSNFENNIALAFLKAAWLQIPHWVHFTLTV